MTAAAKTTSGLGSSFQILAIALVLGSYISVVDTNPCFKPCHTYNNTTHVHNSLYIYVREYVFYFDSSFLLDSTYAHSRRHTNSYYILTNFDYAVLSRPSMTQGLFQLLCHLYWFENTPSFWWHHNFKLWKKWSRHIALPTVWHRSLSIYLFSIDCLSVLIQSHRKFHHTIFGYVFSGLLS